jgi:hypothetical protein
MLGIWRNGGFIMDASTSLDDAKSENMKSDVRVYKRI